MRVEVRRLQRRRAPRLPPQTSTATALEDTELQKIRSPGANEDTSAPSVAVSEESHSLESPDHHWMLQGLGLYWSAVEALELSSSEAPDQDLLSNGLRLLLLHFGALLRVAPKQAYFTVTIPTTADFWIFFSAVMI